MAVEDPKMSPARETAHAGWFEALVENASELFAIVQSDGRLSYLNGAFERLLGFPIETWLGKDPAALVWPEDAPVLADLTQRAIGAPRGVFPFLLRARHADSTVRWLEGTLVNRLDDPRVGGVIVTCRDVTERVAAEDALKASEGRLQQAIRVAGIGIFDHDHLTNSIYLSPRQREIYGWGAEEPASLPWPEFFSRIPPEDVPWVMESIRRAHDPTGDGIWDIEHRFVRSDGSLRWLIARSMTTFEGEGAQRRPVRTVGAIIDDTDRRRADEALRLKDRAIECSINSIAIADAAGTLIYVNPAFVETWGYSSPDEILGKTPVDFVDPEGAKRIMEQLGQGRPFRGELLARRKDGSFFEVAVSANLLQDERGHLTHMMGSFVDISEAKRLQAQLHQSQKMESIGRLAGGVAHDFNNLLTVMKGYVELALADLDQSDPLHHDLDEVRKAADSAASLTQQLLAFSRKQIIRPQVLDLNQVVLRVQKMLRRLLGEDIVLTTILGDGLWPVRFDLGQVEQILINLAVNARDAMPSGGRLTVETTNTALGVDYVKKHTTVEAGDYVMMAVSDTGSGMSPEVRARIFEPFFTTKSAGHGTGLGLAMVYGAVSQNGGRIEVYSEPDVGTTFKIYLPRVNQEISLAPPSPGVRFPRGVETLAVVEDDDMVRELASRALTDLGYKVLSFSRPSAAIEAITQLAEPVDLVITDVIMPEMNGRQMSLVLAERRPGLRILFTSGYTANVIVHHGVLQQGIEFLAKPYSVEQLARRVRELLDQKER